MPEHAPQPVFLKDYRVPDFLVDSVDLVFDLGEEETLVNARVEYRRNPAAGTPAAPLALAGERLDLVGLALDGEPVGVNRTALTERGLTIAGVPDAFTLDVVTRIEPHKNTALQGLYRSGGNFCTQCEAEGFRRITYFLDRPDVLAPYTVTLVADQARYPVLLSNGNRVDGGEAPAGRHWAKWHDPFPKPSYLFALVAGDLVALEDSFITRSGRTVALAIWVRREDLDQCAHAMASLQRAMRWDEETFGLEYDLDLYNIVAVGDFNMGAMENKGLNVFNTALVLARPETATDADYRRIEGVIAHEYFHNWTGNRITCRDWFQLSLKEGLTVYRDQEFSSDTGGRSVKRIQDVRRLRAAQFPEDAGPTAHPVRPESYIEINNFYTPTIYEKGAEVIRMIATLIGPERFRAGMDLYVRRHDGQAVTCEDFVAAMEDAGGVDLGQFRRWYSQAGTPRLAVEDAYDPATGSYTLTMRQHTPSTPGQPDKAPLHIPLAVGLLDGDGRPLPLRLADGTVSTDTVVLQVREAEQTFRFSDVPVPPVPSLLRGFSAPVRLAPPPRERLAFLFAHDPDPFARWEAGQQLAMVLLLEMVAAVQRGEAPVLDPAFITAVDRTLADRRLDRALIAEALVLPSEDYLAEQMDVVDVDAIHAAREAARRAIAAALRDRLLATYTEHRDDGPYTIDTAAMGRRALKNLCLGLLASRPEDETAVELAVTQFRDGANMTDVLAALAILGDHDRPERTVAFDLFYDRWKDHPLVVDKWFMLQANSALPGTLAAVRALARHPAFDLRVPNRARALIAGFAAGNPLRFHGADGGGYAFLAEHVAALDRLNPQLAARMVAPLGRWRRQDPGRQALMRRALEELLAAPGLSRDVYEIVSKSLGA